MPIELGPSIKKSDHVALVRKYGRHLNDCTLWEVGVRVCDCGFAAYEDDTADVSEKKSPMDIAHYYIADVDCGFPKDSVHHSVRCSCLASDIKTAVAEERERCAQICATAWNDTFTMVNQKRQVQRLAEIIREKPLVSEEAHGGGKP